VEATATATRPADSTVRSTTINDSTGTGGGTTSPPRTTRDIGLALSGGGFRAAAFHLGCLRALHDTDLLHRVRIVSGISGGALLAALWAYGPPEFDAFDDTTIELLRRGLQRSLALHAFAPSAVARNLSAAATTIAAIPANIIRRKRATTLRRANRTDSLVAVLAATAFGDKAMPDVTHPGLDVVLTATDLRTGAAVRFGSAASSCSRYGRITEQVTVATAVAASAAYPLLLPALERQFTFTRRGQQHVEPVLLTDGGVYDNLGLSVLEPGRSSMFTDHVYNVPYIISCDAGRGALASKTPHFLASQAARTFEIVHQRAQHAGRTSLHDWGSTGRLDGFVMAYLGMRDDRLPVPLADLVARDKVANYPTNFAPMADGDITALADRGEQLVRTLLPSYCKALV